MLTLTTIKDNLGARSKAKLLGRGIGSSKGKTCGRGGKGQTARTGVAINGFEGGQTPIYRRLPKRGFVNIHRIEAFELTFEKVNTLVKKHGLKSDQVIDRDLLISLGFMKPYLRKISLVATGKIEAKNPVNVCRATKSALEKAEKAGMKITVK